MGAAVRRLQDAGAGGLTHALDEDGFAILRGAAPRATMTRIGETLRRRFDDTPFGHGPFYGNRTKRFGRVLLTAPECADLILHADILEALETVLLRHCDRIQLNTMQAIEIHPGEPQQIPHRDDGMWRVPRDGTECLVNVMWPIDPFSPLNGGTMIWPRGTDPQDAGAAVVAQLDPGDALIFLGSTYHCGGANRCAKPRGGLVIGYALGWLRQHENQYLAYPPEVARRFPRQLTELLGYQIHRPNLGGFEGGCPSRVLDNADIERRFAAEDHLSSEHLAHLDQFRALRKAEHCNG